MHTWYTYHIELNLIGHIVGSESEYGRMKMKFCPYCGNQLEDNMLFCNKCGKPFPVLSDQTDNQTSKSKKKSPLVIFVVILLLALAGFFGWRYYQTMEAEKAVAEKESNYTEGVSAYNNGQYSKALSCFKKAGNNHPDIEYYKILCNGHLYQDLSANDVKTLSNTLDFQDTKAVLMSTDDIAVLFLDGYWSSKDGNNYFEVYSDKDNTHAQYNLPNEQPEDGEYFVIKDGIYYVHTPSKDVELFRFTIYSKDRISVYCYSDKSRIELFREK